VPEDSGPSIDPAVRIAKINMWQAVVVASIAALAGVFSTLAVKAGQSTVSAVKPDGSNLHSAYRWVYPDKSIDNNACVNAAIRVLNSRGTRDLNKSDPGTTLFGHEGEIAIMIACRADHGVALVSAVGTTTVSSLIGLTNDIKTRMDVELQAH
jgi:hypothetical protein